jgi:hypothetical protein
MLCPFSFQRPASPESRGTRVLTPALDLDFAKEGAEWLAPPNTGAVLNTVIRLGHRPFLFPADFGISSADRFKETMWSSEMTIQVR